MAYVQEQAGPEEEPVGRGVLVEGAERVENSDGTEPAAEEGHRF
jgi:hypothetical protein